MTTGPRNRHLVESQEIQCQHVRQVQRQGFGRFEHVQIYHQMGYPARCVSGFLSKQVFAKRKPVVSVHLNLGAAEERSVSLDPTDPERQGGEQ